MSSSGWNEAGVWEGRNFYRIALAREGTRRDCCNIEPKRGRLSAKRRIPARGARQVKSICPGAFKKQISSTEALWSL